MHLFAQSATENLLMPAIFIDKVQIDDTLEQQIFLYYKEAEWSSKNVWSVVFLFEPKGNITSHIIILPK